MGGTSDRLSHLVSETILGYDHLRSYYVSIVILMSSRHTVEVAVQLKHIVWSFFSDKVYDKDTKTSDVYKDVAKPIVEAAIAGFNGTIFAYGQTSSGKTYTMTGTEHSPGIIPLAVYNLFEIIKSIPDRDFLVR